jgi:hypothetical protein
MKGDDMVNKKIEESDEICKVSVDGIHELRPTKISANQSYHNSPEHDCNQSFIAESCDEFICIKCLTVIDLNLKRDDVLEDDD